MSRRRKPREVREVDRATVEVVAAIIGPSSAAQMALDEADRHAGPVRFYKGRDTWFVEKITPPSPGSETPPVPETPTKHATKEE